MENKVILKYPRAKKMQYGEGYVSDFLENITSTFIRKTKFPPSVRESLSNHGHANIIKIVVGKSPVKSVITNILNVMSLGQFKKKINEYNYDDVFHLFMIIYLDNGISLLTEKNEVIVLKKIKPSLKNDAQLMEIQMEQPINLSIFFKNVVDGVGNSLYQYDHRNNNCQVYVNNLLRYNGLSNDINRDFVLQPIEEILRNTPEYMNTIAKMTTNLAGSVDRILYGEGALQNKKIFY